MLSLAGVQLRSDFMQSVRSFFLGDGYLEVDTPVRLPGLLPEAEIAPFTSGSWFLQTSPELCMKRLLARGVPQLFQICHCFRKNEVGRYHAPEFTLLEWYHRGWDYQDLMEECERFLLHLAACCSQFDGIVSGNMIVRDNRSVALASPWQRVTVDEAFTTYAGISSAEALAGDQFDELLVTKVEPHLGWETPVFLYDYPVKLGSLARKKSGASHLAERFELYICGIEVANGFSELIDPGEQRRRFTDELVKIQEKGVSAKMPEKFLYDLEQMKETAGVALGFDRLLMLFQGASALADVQSLNQGEL